MNNPFRKKPSSDKRNQVISSAIPSQFVQFAKQLLESFEIDTFLTATIDLVIDLVEAERGLIILFDKEETDLFEAARDVHRQNLPHPEFEVSHKVIDRVRKTGHSLYLRNALEDALFRSSESVARLKILSIICLPLQVENKIIGVVYLDNRTIVGAFEEETYRTICEFSEFISVAAFRALERKRLKNHVQALEQELRSRYRFDAIIGHHPKIVQILDTLSQVANTDITVLIRGESGTGKELVARSLHFNHLQRRDKFFIPINCGAIPEALLESELFGHTKGAFTGAILDKIGWFERAEGGTIFLDEINEMALSLQVKLLRILQSGEFSRVGSPEIRHCNVRVVAATSKNLQELLAKGMFREDLYYRLNVIELVLPPLRERTSDILLLAGHFLNLYGDKYSKSHLLLSADVEQVLQSYSFPGNIRELENLIQRAIVLTRGDSIELHHLPESVTTRNHSTSTAGTIRSFRETKKSMLEQFEKSYIENCLRWAHGHISKAASVSEMNVKNFYTKMQHYGIDPHNFKSE